MDLIGPDCIGASRRHRLPSASCLPSLAISHGMHACMLASKPTYLPSLAISRGMHACMLASKPHVSIPLPSLIAALLCTQERWLRVSPAGSRTLSISSRREFNRALPPTWEQHSSNCPLIAASLPPNCRQRGSSIPVGLTRGRARGLDAWGGHASAHHGAILSPQVGLTRGRARGPDAWGWHAGLLDSSAGVLMTSDEL